MMSMPSSRGGAYVSPPEVAVAALRDMSYRELVLELCQVEDAISRVPHPQHPTSDQSLFDSESAWAVVTTLAAYEMQIVQELRRRPAPAPGSVSTV